MSSDQLRLMKGGPLCFDSKNLGIFEKPSHDEHFNIFSLIFIKVFEIQLIPVAFMK